jgi:hypothetical protein
MLYPYRPKNTVVSKGNSPFWFNVHSTFRKYFSSSGDPIVFSSGLQPFCHSFAREHKEVANIPGEQISFLGPSFFKNYKSFSSLGYNSLYSYMAGCLLKFGF